MKVWRQGMSTQALVSHCARRRRSGFAFDIICRAKTSPQWSGSSSNLNFTIKLGSHPCTCLKVQSTPHEVFDCFLPREYARFTALLPHFVGHAPPCVQSVIGLDKPPGSLFGRSFYEFAIHRCMPNKNRRRFIREKVLPARRETHAVN
jgi:hypothetical protein